MKRFLTRARQVAYLLLLSTMLAFGSAGSKVLANAVCPQGMSDLDCQAVLGNWPDWVPESGSACGSTTGTDTSTTQSGSSTTAQQIAQTFIIGLDASNPNAKDIATDLATKYHIGGIFLVNAANGAVATQQSNAAQKGFTKTFYDSLNKAAGTSLVVSSDEEGAITRYYYPSGVFPTAKQMGDQPANNFAAAKKAGQDAGKVMADNGITADLGPVLDLRDVGVAGRSFSKDPNVVAKAAGAFASGLGDAGVVPIFKHFPGFDDSTNGSTDDQKVVMTGSVDKTVIPYKTLLAKNPKAGVMLSNMYVNKLDPDNPSSLSTRTVKYLQNDLNFKGMITTDDLSVSSVLAKVGGKNNTMALANAVSQSLQAGVTMPLFKVNGSSTSEAESIMDAVIATVQGNSGVMSGLPATLQKIQAFKGSQASTSSTSGSGGCCSTSTDLSGNGNKAKIWNFFIGKGLSAAATAGIMGNWTQESGFDPSIEQNPGAWEDMSDLYAGRGGKGGVGLSQWDGPRRPAVITYLKNHGFSDADLHHATDSLLGAELNYVWGELMGPYKSTHDTIQKDTDPQQAAYDFHQEYEGSSDSPEAIKQGRMIPAANIYKEFSGQSVDTSTASPGSIDCAASPDCSGAQGSAKILCAARSFDNGSYIFGDAHSSAKAWIKDHCTPVTPSCSMDCSGLVNLAVYTAFGVDLMEDTSSERTDTTHWKEVPIDQVQPGDILQPESSHVEVVDHRSGNTIYTFGAHTDSYPQPKQVSPSSYEYNASVMHFYHFTGADNSSSTGKGASAS